MDNAQNTSVEGTQTGTGGAQQGERMFTQEEVNRIVQDRLGKEKTKGNAELDKRAAELDNRERRMNAVEELRKNGLPDYLVDALNMETDEAFQQSMEAVLKMKGENPESQGQQSRPIGTIIGHGAPIGTVNRGTHDPVRTAFGLR